VWTATRRDTDPGACPQFSFTKQQRRVLVLYVYIWDKHMGGGFIKICTYFPLFPFPGKPVHILRFTYAEWDAFLDGARRAEFDHLTTT
jgi:hypothetical protein